MPGVRDIRVIATTKSAWVSSRSRSRSSIDPYLFIFGSSLFGVGPGSRRPVLDRSPHFPVFPEFQGASYLQRYHLLCQRLMQERLYTVASVIASAHHTETVRVGAW
jgi:hypothetical protein